MRICVVGGGNLGHYIVAKLGNDNEVSVYTSRPEAWGSCIEARDISGKVFAGRVYKVSSNPQEVLQDAELIFVTWPTHILSHKVDELEPYVNENKWICLCPGYGGKEFICNKLVEKGAHLIGTQRVFSSTKVLEYGKTVECIDNRPLIQIGTMKSEDKELGRQILFELFQKECVVYPNYLNITLTPSNPVLHTSRLFSLFKDYTEEMVYPIHYKFYSEWSEESSDVLLKCDAEVQEICLALSRLDMSGVKSLRDHYQIEEVKGCINDKERMTKKIRSLKFLKDFAPMKSVENGYIPDLDARYFLEDFQFGLQVIIEFATILNTGKKQMEEIMSWQRKIIKDKQLNGEKAYPRSCKIATKEDIYKFYQR